MINKNTLFLLSVVALGLSGCSNAREELGLDKKAPDEFAVVKRAPLELPPDYTLRPPRPGAQRPQEITPQQAARKTVFGTPIPVATKQPGSAEEALLQATGAVHVDNNIRDVVDNESNALRGRNRSVADKLLGNDGGENPSATTVDAAAESQRIRDAINNGQTISGEGSIAREE